MSGDTGVSGFIKNTQTEAIVRAAPPTIYDVASARGGDLDCVASTVEAGTGELQHRRACA